LALAKVHTQVAGLLVVLVTNLHTEMADSRFLEI
jgi:hypothetical protein